MYEVKTTFSNDLDIWWRQGEFQLRQISYRTGQPNWEFSMWKFNDISATQILCEFNYGHFEAPKTAILTICAALNFEFLENFDI